jgi:methionyl-tRNA synthetase
MSKSVGNVIDPIAIVEEYGADALRYYLARHVHPFEDSDFTMEKFKEAYNADLANGLGNLVARVTKLAVDNEIQVRKKDLELLERSFVMYLEQKIFLKEYQINRAVEAIWKLIEDTNVFIQTSEPFKTIKVDRKKAETDIQTALLYLVEIAIKLRPFMPVTSKKIEEAIKENKKPENLFPRKD